MPAQTASEVEKEDRAYQRAVGSLVSEVISSAKRGIIKEKRLSRIANQLRDVAESYPLQASTEGLTNIQAVREKVLSQIRDRLGASVVPVEIAQSMEYESLLIAMTPERKRTSPH